MYVLFLVNMKSELLVFIKLFFVKVDILAIVVDKMAMLVHTNVNGGKSCVEGSVIMGKELGLRITEILQKRGMTQRELALRIGVTEAVISRYVSGCRDPKPNVLANIATALHTTSDYLLGIECDEFNHSRIRRMIARNASSMTEEEKRELINALFGEV